MKEETKYKVDEIVFCNGLVAKVESISTIAGTDIPLYSLVSVEDQELSCSVEEEEIEKYNGEEIDQSGALSTAYFASYIIAKRVDDITDKYCGDYHTPDTEFDSDKEVVGSDCLCVLGSKKHNPECEYATPDIEWEKVVEEFYLNFTDIEKQELDTPSWNHNGVTPYLVEQWIRTLLTSRDTYWKERVEEVVRGMKLDTSPAEGYTNPIADDYNKACDDILQALDNLK